MTSTFLQALALAIFLVVAMEECVFSLRWNWTYFSVGIRIFHRLMPVLDPKASIPTEERLEAISHESAFPPLAFWLLEPDRFAFRERIGGGLRLGYPPVMRGNLRFQRRGARVEAIGLLNWSVLAFLGLAGYSVLVFESPIFLVGAVVLLIVIYVIQFRRFSQAARAAATEWSFSRRSPIA